MDKATFAQHVLALEPTLYRVAYSYTGSAADAGDAVQEALLRAWMRLDTLRNESAFAPWLIRILINECKTLLRKRHRMVLLAEPPAPVAAGDDRAAVLALREALLRLRPDERTALVLTGLEHYTIRETAQMLYLPESTVKSRIARGRRKLLEDLKDRE